MPPPWNATRTKVQLRLSVQRLRTLQEKNESLVKSLRREIATLIEQGKLEKARIKVERLINDELQLELLELMELYCELLLARFGLIELNSREPDQGVSEGICSIIHAAPRTELKELQTLREMLVQKYGREFAQAAMENRENCVSERVMNKLRFTTPSTELVTAYCAEIARGYGVPWVADEQFTGENDDSDADGGAKEKPPVEVEASLVTAGEKPIKLPDIPPTETRPASATGKPKSPAPKAPEEDELAALTKRFEALRKK